jgi:hypothetical protein
MHFEHPPQDAKSKGQAGKGANCGIPSSKASRTASRREDLQRGTGKEGLPLLRPRVVLPQLPLHTTCNGSTSTTKNPHTHSTAHAHAMLHIFCHQTSVDCHFFIFSGVAPLWEMLPFFHKKKALLHTIKPTKTSYEQLIGTSSLSKSVALGLVLFQAV